MKTKAFGLILSVAVLIAAASCKKEKSDNSINGRFQGNWIESSAKQSTLVVTTDPNGTADTPNLFLTSGGVGYPMIYRFNSSGDTIYLSTSATEQNVPYKITFTADYQSFTIKKFHATLPAVDPVTFNRLK